MGKKAISLLVVALMLFTMIPSPCFSADSIASPATDKTTHLKTGLLAALKSETLSTTPDSITITTPDIIGVTIPVTGAAPVTAIPPTTAYTATISWDGNPTVFAADTAYTAIITILPDAGYTLDGVGENFFLVAGATATNAANSGVVTAVFPKTGPAAPQLLSAATSADGTVVTLTFDKAMADPSADADSFAVKIHGIAYIYGIADIPVTKPVTVASAALNTDTKKIDLEMASPLKRGDIITVDYTPGAVTAADTAALAAFSNKPVANTIPVDIVTNLEGTWQIFDHVGNWQESAFITGDDSRGREYNRHIVIIGNTVYFYGNGIHPFKDFLYLPSNEAAAKSFTFDLDLSGVKYHSMEGGGFLFNTVLDNGTISGYCALFTKDGDFFELSLYQLENVNVNDFHDGNGNYYNLSVEGDGITLLGSYPLSSVDKHTITLECSATSLDMWDGNTKLIEKLVLPKKYSYGVGIIGSYQDHWCNELSYFIFSNLKIEGIADLSAVLAGDQANLTFTALTDATSVTVEQSTDAVNWTPASLLVPINASSTTATVTGLTRYQTYYFRLVITGGQYAGYSRAATAPYIVGPINNLAAAAGNGTVNLTFTPPNGASALTVQQSTDGGETWGPATLAGPITPTSTSATITGLVNGQRYSFKIVVSAEEGGGDSNVVNATPAVPDSTPNYYYYDPADVVLTIAKTGEGTVLPGVGTHAYDTGTTVMLIATPAEGYTFEGWTGTTGNQVYMDQNKTITAVFKSTAVSPATPSPTPEPTLEPTPTPVVIPEEPEPGAPVELPKTGGIPAALLYGIGGSITAAGIYLKKKRKDK